MSVLQCGVVCCSMLQCVAVCHEQSVSAGAATAVGSDMCNTLQHTCNTPAKHRNINPGVVAVAGSDMCDTL